MRETLTVLALEWRRVSSRRNLLVYAAFVLLCAYFTQVGVNEYRNVHNGLNDFFQTEQLKYNSYVSFALYGAYGHRLLFMPTAASVFFINTSVITELTANVDAGERLHIYNSYKGKTLFRSKSAGYKDVAGMFFLFGSLLVLFLGFEAFHPKDYIRFQCALIPIGRLHFSILCSRLLLLGGIFLTVGAACYVTVLINHITLEVNDLVHLFHYLVTTFLMLVFFFLAGAVAGAMRSRFVGFLSVIIIWFSLIFLVPGALHSIMAQRADDITSTYQLELQKLQTLMGFEQRIIQKAGYYSQEKARTGSGRGFAEEYWEIEMRAIETFEKQLQDELAYNMNLYFKLSLFTPTTFYLAVGNEVSSKGYKQFLNFFTYIRNLKMSFVRFYLDNRFYGGSKKGEAYIDQKKSVYYSRSRLPDFYLLGIFCQLGYCLLLLILSLSLFRRALMK